MAGRSPSFDTKTVRAALREAMTIGLPEATAERPTFVYRRRKVYPPGTRLDRDGNPLDPNVSPTIVEPTPVQVPVTVEFDQAPVEELPPGAVRNTRVTITVLDEDWQTLLAHDAAATPAGPIKVLLGGDAYTISYVAPPFGLYDLTVYQLYCFATEGER